MAVEHDTSWYEQWRKADPVGYRRHFEQSLRGEYRGYLDELKKRKPRTWVDYLDEIQERKDLERIYLWIHSNMPDLCTCSSCTEDRAYLLKLTR